MKRDTARAYVNMKLDATLPHYASGNILDDPPPFPSLCIYFNERPICQPKDK